MKARIKLLMLVLAVAPLVGDTQLTGSQIRPCLGNCIMVSHRGLSGWVELGAGLEIVDVGGRLVLQATGGGGSTPDWVKRAEVVLSPQASWVLLDSPITGSLSISRNGANLVPGEDWELTGQMVTFLASNVPKEGDVLDFHYQK